jgi:hypothetical protein
MSKLYATAITLRCPGCGLTKETERAPWDPPAAAQYDLYCGRCATGGKTGGIGTYRDEGGREIFEGRGGMKRYTVEEVGAWSDAAVLHEAVEIVRGMAPGERRALVVALAIRAQPDAEGTPAGARGAASYADLHAPHGESCNCSDCQHRRRNDEWIAGAVAAMRPDAGPVTEHVNLRIPTCQTCGHQKIDADAEPRPRCQLCRTDWNGYCAEAKRPGQGQQAASAAR